MPRMRYTVTATEVKERYFTCERCGAFGDVQFQAIGKGYAEDSLWRDDASVRATSAAQDALQADSEGVYRMIRCPACKLRPKGAFLGMYVRIGLPTVIGLAALIPEWW